MNSNNRIKKLEEILRPLYEQYKERLLFHGWNHIRFVQVKSKFFAEKISADLFLVESSALVHDLNYIVKLNSEPGEGRTLRENILREAGYDQDEISTIEKIIDEANLGTRTAEISEEGKALSDADTLFKALPITSIFFTGKYLAENKVDITTLAKKICDEQVPLLEKGIYFYTDFAQQHYLKWAKTNLDLWQNIRDCLSDSDIKDVIEGFE